MRTISLIFIILIGSFSNDAFCVQVNAVPTLAIIDTGFALDHKIFKDITIVDAYDFTDNDENVSPYIPRSSSANETAKRIKEILKIQPNLSKWFDPKRAIEKEFLAAGPHGTAVASIATHGLKVKAALYKVYPIPEGVNPDQWMASSVLNAMNRAVEHGARVINLSLGFTYSSKGANKDHENFSKQFSDFAKNNPNVLLIAASGNENQTIDNKTIFGYPCGLTESNVICVGALDQHGKIWSPSISKGTNLVSIPGITMIFAPGEKIKSASPPLMCATKQAASAILKNTPLIPDELANIYQSCQAQDGFAFGEATSIATPFVTHEILRILNTNPDMSLAKIKEKMIAKTDEGMSNIGKIRTMNPNMPTWPEFNKK